MKIITINFDYREFLNVEIMFIKKLGKKHSKAYHPDINTLTFFYLYGIVFYRCTHTNTHTCYVSELGACPS